MTTIGTMLRRAAERYQYKPAAVCGRESRSFFEIDQVSDRVAALLQANGIGPGARVAIVRGNGIRFIEDEFGILKAGAAEVPVNPRLGTHEMVQLLQSADPVAVVIGDEFCDRAGHFEVLPSVRLLISGDEERDRLLSDVSATPTVDLSSPQSLLWRLHYTSGTTGTPKAVELTHRNFRLSVWSYLLAVRGIRPVDVFLDPCPLGTSGGWGLWPHYLSGATSVIMPRFDPGEFVELAEMHGVTTTLMVPTMINDVLDVLDTPDPLRSLQTVMYTAAPISLKLLEDALERFGPIFVQAYAMSETMTALAVLPKEDHEPGEVDRRRSAGRPSMDVEVKIVDPNDCELPLGEIGRVVLRTDAVMQGYWRDPEQTAKSLREGWLFSGDAGRLTDDGYLYILDRLDDVIISGGFNVYPLEVEDVIIRHPGIAEAAVIGMPDDRLGEIVTAVVRGRPGSEFTPQDIIAHCRDKLAGYKRPKRVEIVSEALPRNAAGKVLRRELRNSSRESQSASRS